MSDTFAKARDRVNSSSASCWNLVAGPAAAVYATCDRLRWQSSDGRKFIDDMGDVWDMAIDSPAAVRAAVTRSVTRMRMDLVLGETPMARPCGNDIGYHSQHGAKVRREARERSQEDSGQRQPPAPRDSVLVDLTPYIKKLTRDGIRLAKLLPQWSSSCRPYLISAMSGGQWTQARKAKLPECAGVNTCQLCQEEVGTAQHRHNCKVTKPAGGWTKPPPKTQKFLDSIGPDRGATLRDRAVLTVQIPTPAPQTPDKGWKWLSPPPPMCDPTLTWIIDGSRRYAADWILSTTGCGVAVINADDELVAYACATPPNWVRTAGAAEAWALQLTLSGNALVPNVITDCMALVNAAAQGPEVAAGSKRMDARIWRQIADTLNGDFTQLRQRLVWMPAHTKAEAIGHKKKSDGSRVTTTQWRANQLADVLAKRAAMKSPLREEAQAKIEDAGNALIFAAAQLGVVTHAANNHVEWHTVADGRLIKVTKRDSMSASKRAQKSKASKKVEAPAASSGAPNSSSLNEQDQFPCQEPTLRQEKAAAKREIGKKRKSDEQKVVLELISSNAASAIPQERTAQERMAALRARTLSRTSVGS